MIETVRTSETLVYYVGIQGNQFRIVKPSVQTWHTSLNTVRKEKVMLTRLRTVHTRLTHGHILSGEPAPLCIYCDVPLTVSHVLIECPRQSEACRGYHLHSALAD
jgi:hypothetical protein